MASSIQNVKSQLRTQMKTRRDNVPILQRKQASVNLSNLFMGNIPFNRQDIIAFYWPIGSEIDIRLMADALIEQGHICVLPAIESQDKPLIFRRYHKTQQLVNNSKYNVYEPPNNAQQMHPTIMMIPLLAFDILGNRLGYGGGFYDRTLKIYKNKSNFMSVGVAYDFMQVQKVPVDKYDEKLDCIITDKRITIC